MKQHRKFHPSPIDIPSVQHEKSRTAFELEAGGAKRNGSSALHSSAECRDESSCRFSFEDFGDEGTLSPHLSKQPSPPIQTDEKIASEVPQGTWQFEEYSNNSSIDYPSSVSSTDSFNMWTMPANPVPTDELLEEVDTLMSEMREAIDTGVTGAYEDTETSSTGNKFACEDKPERDIKKAGVPESEEVFEKASINDERRHGTEWTLDCHYKMNPFDSLSHICFGRDSPNEQIVKERTHSRKTTICCQADESVEICLDDKEEASSDDQPDEKQISIGSGTSPRTAETLPSTEVVDDSGTVIEVLLSCRDRCISLCDSDDSSETQYEWEKSLSDVMNTKNALSIIEEGTEVESITTAGTKRANRAYGMVDSDKHSSFQQCPSQELQVEDKQIQENSTETADGLPGKKDLTFSKAAMAKARAHSVLDIDTESSAGEASQRKRSSSGRVFAFSFSRTFSFQTAISDAEDESQGVIDNVEVVSIDFTTVSKTADNSKSSRKNKSTGSDWHADRCKGNHDKEVIPKSIATLQGGEIGSSALTQTMDAVGNGKVRNNISTMKDVLLRETHSSHAENPIADFLSSMKGKTFEPINGTNTRLNPLESFLSSINEIPKDTDIDKDEWKSANEVSIPTKESDRLAKPGQTGIAKDVIFGSVAVTEGIGILSERKNGSSEMMELVDGDGDRQTEIFKCDGTGGSSTPSLLSFVDSWENGNFGSYPPSGTKDKQTRSIQKSPLHSILNSKNRHNDVHDGIQTSTRIEYNRGIDEVANPGLGECFLNSVQVQRAGSQIQTLDDGSEITTHLRETVIRCTLKQTLNSKILKEVLDTRINVAGLPAAQGKHKGQPYTQVMESQSTITLTCVTKKNLVRALMDTRTATKEGGLQRQRDNTAWKAKALWKENSKEPRGV